MNFVTTRKISWCGRSQHPRCCYKSHVDTSIKTEIIPITLDVTGLGTGSTLHTNIATILNDIAPAVNKQNGS